MTMRTRAAPTAAANEVVVLFEWDSVENAQAFASSDNLREAMQKAGVVSKPNIYFLD